HSRARSPHRSWWPVLVAAGLAAATVGVAVFAVRLPAGEPVARLTPEGTPRHALALLGDRLAVLDLVTGAAPAPMAAPDPVFFQYTAITRDTRPGAYLAAVTTAGDGAFGGRSSRVYRIVMDGEGGAAIGEQVGGDLDGMVLDLAVSPRGQIAYSRVAAVPGDTLAIGTTFVGLVRPRREWAAPGGQGVTFPRKGELGLHWRDAATLAFHAVPPSARAPRLLALAVARPGSDLLAAEELYAMEEDSDGTGLTVPGGTAMAVSRAGGRADLTQEILVFEPSAKRPASSPAVPAFATGCGAIQGFTSDRAGRHLLVAVDRSHPACGNGAGRELVRVDLRQPAAPGHRLWQGDQPVSAVVW
uniref:hypothetical protein n=1 Tax=Nonomuraea lactucae TaxID=2249762 RepID=UPI0013B3949B